MTRNVLLAFPGMGKTTVCKQVAGLVDLDFGYIRSGWEKIPRKLSTEWIIAHQQDALYMLFQHLAKIYSNEGFTILTNEPSTIPWLKQLDLHIYMVLPNPGIDMGKRVLDRYNDHPVNKTWTNLYAKHWQAWCDSWAEQATKYRIPIIHCNYLYDDWDKIMKEVDNNV